MDNPEFIRLRGARQNNLTGFDLDIPLDRYVVVTGLSGAGKSSLVFDTLHAEGQRRYVETFSAYTRQFLDLLPKPRIDAIENIRPSIAIEQTNTVKTSRSTVGTMTELNDYFKVWFSHHAACFDPVTGERVEDDTPQSIWSKVAAGPARLIAFRIARPGNLSWREILASLTAQGYTRLLLPAAADGRLQAVRIDESTAPAADQPAYVVQDRIDPRTENRGRFVEAVEAAMHFGRGEVHLFSDPDLAPAGHYSRGLHSPATGRVFRAATPALFSFNSPLGACPRCRGFGRIIEIDYRLAIPDRSLSIDAGAIRCWEGAVYGESKADLKRFARRRGIPTDLAFAALSAEQQAYVIDGEPGYGEESGKTWPKFWYGVKGFFRWLEKSTYKMHVRVFLSRYRAYNTCPDCAGQRLQPEALCWKWQGRTLPELYALSVRELRELMEPLARKGTPEGNRGGPSDAVALDSIVTRLRYLAEVGLGYLTLDRPSKTLSGGEVQRVNLTSCLGTALVDTLFVLDEPSVGLHPRDIDRLIGIIRSLTDAGNTVIVVEHDEAMIRAADQVIEIGPEPGERGGRVVFQGSVPALLRAPDCLTGDYLSGRRSIAVPTQRRPVAAADRTDSPAADWLVLRGVRKHNLQDVTVRVPLRRLVGLSGVSGSGKSTLLDHAIHQGLRQARHHFAEDPAAIAAIEGAESISDIVMVDQSPLARTPRSNPAIYAGAWEAIRDLYAATPDAQAAGLSASSFSFNSGDGRCEHCQGLGCERVEMQFLSDVFVPCPICEGRRFKPEVLAIAREGRTVADLLDTSVGEARALFAAHPRVAGPLAALATVGLDYLKLGQPLNTLSGGESQRLKLVRYLGEFAGETAPAGALLLLDEPTTGLHRHDVLRLLAVLQALVDRGHSVVVIEHNADVLKSADWIIEIGPEAGSDGGRIVAEGPPEAIARSVSATSPYLRTALRGASDVTAIGRAANRRIAPGASGPARDGAIGGPAAGAAETAGISRTADVRRVLRLTGARENNLQNLAVEIPHHQLNVVTGVSGSGKSTLAFDIIFAEGQRRFMESMSPYARQFVEQLPRPDIDRLTGIPPTVAIEQRVTRGSRKSTVATITEVAQYLRLLYARQGVQHHPDSGRAVAPLSPPALRRLLGRILAGPDARRAAHLYLCAPLIRGRKGHHQPIADWIGRQGFTQMRADGRVLPVAAFRKLDRYREHDIEVVVADLKADSPNPPALVLATALRLGKGSCFLVDARGTVLSWLSTTRTDAASGESFPELEPKHFSFNSPRGWCPSCRGHGRIYPWMLEPADEDDDPLARLREFGIDRAEAVADEGQPCPDCGGARLNRISRAVRLHLRGDEAVTLPELLRGTASEVLARLRRLPSDARTRLIAGDLVAQIEARLKFLDRVGLGYLALERPTDTLSGGEAQRIRLAAQLGSNLSGVLYVLDEPSIGLHARDNERLIATLEVLRAKGNTLLVVEHDDEIMEHADRIIDLGPGAGVHGGQLLAAGSPAEIKRCGESLTGVFLSRGIVHPLRGERRPLPPAKARDAWIDLRGARWRNLKGVDLRLPIGRLTLVAGPSGAGKSTMIRDLLQPAVAHAIKRGVSDLTGVHFVRATGFAAAEADPVATGRSGTAGRSTVFKRLRLPQAFRSVITVDQSPIGKTPRSTPATYLGIFDLIRGFFAALPESKMRGFTASRFSFNVAGGRCPTCEGAGRVKLEMAFMPDVYLPCEDCRGRRYGPDLADVTWKGKTIGDVLQLTFEEAAAFFGFHAQLGPVCRLMADCGLDYLTLGQSSPTLSGGEAQRLKLVTELAHGLATYRERRRGTLPQNLYVLEEPTIGLHLSDCEKLIRVLHALVDQGHTVVVIEHNLDLLAEADYIVELGPIGGPDGGELLYQGPLDGLLAVRRSPTAPYLRAKLRPKPA